MKRYFLLFCLLAFPFSGGGAGAAAQDDASRIRVSVVLVQLNVAVTDNKGNYISGLKPEDFAITEDKIPEKPATFEEGNGPTRRLMEVAPSDGKPLTQVADNTSGGQDSIEGSNIESSKKFAGANVFILFDTSNYMYRGFVFAQDAIADFIRSLEGVSKVALYSYSRDLSKVTALTPDRSQVLRGVRNTVAGDDAALYNGLLMTVKDAAPLTGRKPGGRGRTRSINRNDHLYDQHATGGTGTGLHGRLRTHEQSHRRQSLFLQGLAGRKAGIRLNPRRPGKPLHHQLLPCAESQPWLALHQCEACRQKSAEVPHPHSGRISRASDRSGKPVRA